MALSSEVETGSREENASKQEVESRLSQTQKTFAPPPCSRKANCAEEYDSSRRRIRTADQPRHARSAGRRQSCRQLRWLRDPNGQIQRRHNRARERFAYWPRARCLLQ